MAKEYGALIDQLIDQRRKKGMTQKQLATAANLTQAAIGRVESKKNVPQLDTLLKVVNALGCDLMLVPSDKAEYVAALLEYHESPTRTLE